MGVDVLGKRGGGGVGSGDILEASWYRLGWTWSSGAMSLWCAVRLVAVLASNSSTARVPLIIKCPPPTSLSIKGGEFINKQTNMLINQLLLYQFSRRRISPSIKLTRSVSVNINIRPAVPTRGGPSPALTLVSTRHAMPSRVCNTEPCL